MTALALARPGQRETSNWASPAPRAYQDCLGCGDVMGRLDHRGCMDRQECPDSPDQKEKKVIQECPDCPGQRATLVLPFCLEREDNLDEVLSPREEDVFNTD